MSGTTTPLPALGVVVFDPIAWAAAYPELSGSVSAAQATGYFQQATLFLDNSPTSAVTDATPGGQRATLLNLIVAHIAKLFAVLNGEGPSGLVGAIASATEGSVSVSLVPVNAGSGAMAAWFAQTPYGLMYWAATAGFRTMRYRPAQPRCGWQVPGYGLASGSSAGPF
jgi:hypothetical protein